MSSMRRLVLVCVIGVASLAGFVGSASAATSDGSARAGHAVFVQTDDPTGNRVVVYDRSDGGGLTAAGTYATGGLGGVLAGSVVDHLASQGSLTFDPRHGLLYAVNAGSNTLSVFAVQGDRLALRQVVNSRGQFPVSVTVHGDLVYVLNALNGGSLQGFRTFFGFLIPLIGSSRPLGLDPTETPQFTHTPGQVAFSPSGSQLVVTTKANGSAIDVFGVRVDGRLSATPVVNPEPGTVPFAVSFDAAGHLVVAEAGTNALATFTLNGDGTTTLLSQVATGQAATCWVEPARGILYASNAGSASLSAFSSSPSGQLSLLGATTTDPGTVDAAASPDGQFLYAQTGANGVIDAFRTHPDGTLTPIGTVTIPASAGAEGIATS